MVLTTETLEGVATPVTVPPPLEDELPPLHAVRRNENTAIPKESLKMDDCLSLLFMMWFLVCKAKLIKGTLKH